MISTQSYSWLPRQSMSTNSTKQNTNESTKETTKDTKKEAEVLDAKKVGCPEYAWNDNKDYYNVPEEEKYSQMFLLIAQNRERYVQSRGKLQKKLMDYRKAEMKRKGIKNVSQMSDDEINSLIDIQKSTYNMLDLSDVLSYPLKTMINYFYNEMEKIHEKDEQEFENDKIIKRQM